MALIVVTGKGGVGKSTLTATLVRLLQAEGRMDFTVVDADPVGALTMLLGAPDRPTITEAYNNSGKVQAFPAEGEKSGMSFEAHVKPLMAPLKGGGHLVSMGHHREESCFCRINGLTRAAIQLILNRYPLVLMDNEAGLEHLTRGTGRHAARLIMMADQSRASLKVAQDILETARELNREGAERLKGTAHLGVRSGNGATEAHRHVLRTIARDLSLPSPVFLPFDAHISMAQMAGDPLLEFSDALPFYQAVKAWVDTERFLDVRVPTPRQYVAAD